jgi:hypothetical protein
MMPRRDEATLIRDELERSLVAGRLRGRPPRGGDAQAAQPAETAPDPAA